MGAVNGATAEAMKKMIKPHVEEEAQGMEHRDEGLGG